MTILNNLLKLMHTRKRDLYGKKEIYTWKRILQTRYCKVIEINIRKFYDRLSTACYALSDSSILKSNIENVFDILHFKN